MSRKAPRIEGGSASGLEELEFGRQQIDSISIACGVQVDHAREGIRQALGLYLFESLAENTAPTVKAAEARLTMVLKLASELRGLNAVWAGDEPEALLRARLRLDLDLPDNVATRLGHALADYESVAERVLADLRDEGNSQPSSSQELARRLALIWNSRLRQRLTLSESKDGSPFARFVLAAVRCLPRDWPWCPGRPEPHSTGAFVQALRRELDGWTPPAPREMSNDEGGEPPQT